MSSAFRVSDRMAFLLEGKVHKIGTPDEFRKSDDEKVKQFVYGESEGPLRKE
jgi:ABC-type transporter Mla maintaining outer membrane lipid asymmetry ATPase subunit MlaF